MHLQLIQSIDIPGIPDQPQADMYDQCQKQCYLQSLNTVSLHCSRQIISLCSEAAECNLISFFILLYSYVRVPSVLPLLSQEVVKAIQAAQGVKHLVSMTTSEHAAMQNEALTALAIASAIDLGIFFLKAFCARSSMIKKHCHAVNSR